jgi:hypothetical protein
MITLISAWLSDKIVAVLAVSLVTVSAVPTALVLTTEHQTTVILAQQETQQRVVLIQEVTKAGDELIVKLKTAEQSCDMQVANLVTDAAKPKVETNLVDAKAMVHASLTPFITAIQLRQDKFKRLAIIDARDKEDELSQLHLIEVMAFGTDKTTGSVTVTCSTVSSWMQQIVVIVTLPQQTTVTLQPRECRPHYQYEKEGSHVQIEYQCD